MSEMSFNGGRDKGEGVAALLAAGVGWLGSVFRRVVAIELWARRVTAIVIILVGLHYSLAYTLPALGRDLGWGR